MEGGAAVEPEPGWERIAYVAGLDDAETAELADARRPGGRRRHRRRGARRAELDRRQRFESVAVLVRDAS